MKFNRESFEIGKDWFFESKICLSRSFKIRENPNDIHGAIEALQHCFELSCKSLYIMLGLQYPRDHDAAKNLDKVRRKLFQAIPETDQDQWPPLESWIKDNSKYMKKIHETCARTCIRIMTSQGSLWNKGLSHRRAMLFVLSTQNLDYRVNLPWETALQTSVYKG